MSREIAIDSTESFRAVITYTSCSGDLAEYSLGSYALKHLAISAGKREVGPSGRRSWRIQRTNLNWEDVA